MAHGAGARRSASVILALETSCDDTCAAVVTSAGEIRSNAISSQGLLHARYGGVVPEIASRRHLELVDAVTADALERAGATLDEIDVGGGDPQPGPDRRAAGGRLEREGRSRRRGGCRSRRSTTCTATSWPRRFSRTRSSRPTSAWWRAGDTPSSRVWTTRAPTRCSARRSTTPRERRSTRARGCSACPIRAVPRWIGWRARAIPSAFDFPRSLPGDGLDFSFSGLKTALLYAVRDLGDGAEERRADLAASYQRAIVAALIARLGQAVGREKVPRVALGGGVAANSELGRRRRSCAPASGWSSTCRRRSCAPTTPP